MRVVSNTSPICNLAAIGRLSLLRARYAQIFIPLEVLRELSRFSHPSGQREVQTALVEGWIVPEPVSPGREPILASLDEGETEAITLAITTKADFLLIDEKRGRECARSLGLNVAGLLGELLHAKHTGAIPSLKHEFNLLRQRAGFYISKPVELLFLAEAREQA